MPFDNLATMPSLTRLIKHQQDALKIEDASLADALGYGTADVIALIKDGRMRLPMSKARSLAEALELEPGEVLYLLLRETSPEMLASIEECLAPLALTRAEARLIAKLREKAEGRATAPLLVDGDAVVAIVVLK